MSAPKLNFSSFAEAYEAELVNPLFRPFAEDLVRRVGVAAGNSVIDVACGTGIVARVSKPFAREGTVTGVDANPDMLKVATAVDPTIDWRQGDAASLPVDGAEKYDIAFCHQGLQFFPDKAAAVAELGRVLKADGKLGVGTWCGVEESPFNLALHELAVKHFGEFVDMRYGFGNGEAIAALLYDAGFGQIEISIATLPVSIGDPMQFVGMNLMAQAGASGLEQRTDESEREAILNRARSELPSVVERFAHAGNVTFDLKSTVVTAHAQS